MLVHVVEALSIGLDETDRQREKRSAKSDSQIGKSPRHTGLHPRQTSRLVLHIPQNRIPQTRKIKNPQKNRRQTSVVRRMLLRGQTPQRTRRINPTARSRRPPRRKKRSQNRRRLPNQIQQETTRPLGLHRPSLSLPQNRLHPNPHQLQNQNNHAIHNRNQTPTTPKPSTQKELAANDTPSPTTLTTKTPAHPHPPSTHQATHATNIEPQKKRELSTQTQALHLRH
jgi:hypothetical protein